MIKRIFTILMLLVAVGANAQLSAISTAATNMIVTKPIPLTIADKYELQYIAGICDTIPYYYYDKNYIDSVVGAIHFDTSAIYAALATKVTNNFTPRRIIVSGQSYLRTDDSFYADTANHYIGLGTQSPAARLHVKQNSATPLYVEFVGTQAGSSFGMQLKNPSGSLVQWGMKDNAPTGTLKLSSTEYATFNNAGFTFGTIAGTSGAQNCFAFTGNPANTSGTSTGLRITTGGNNSSTGGQSALLVNMNSTLNGSAPQRIADFQRSSTSVAWVDSSGAYTGKSYLATSTWAASSITGRLTVGTTTDNATDALQINGDMILKTAGNKIKIPTGTNSISGTVSLSSGTATVNTTSVAANSIIHLTLQSCSSCGTIYISAKTAGTSFVITSSNASDASTVGYLIINQ